MKWFQQLISASHKRFHWTICTNNLVTSLHVYDFWLICTLELTLYYIAPQQQYLAYTDSCGVCLPFRSADRHKDTAGRWRRSVQTLADVTAQTHKWQDSHSIKVHYDQSSTANARYEWSLTHLRTTSFQKCSAVNILPCILPALPVFLYLLSPSHEELLLRFNKVTWNCWFHVHVANKKYEQSQCISHQYGQYNYSC